MTQAQLESWEAIKSQANKKERLVIDALASHPDGLTAWEIAKVLATTPRYTRQDYAPRITSLVNKGIVAETGKSRMTESGRRGEIYQLYSIWAEQNKSAL